MCTILSVRVDVDGVAVAWRGRGGRRGVHTGIDLLRIALQLWHGSFGHVVKFSGIIVTKTRHIYCCVCTRNTNPKECRKCSWGVKIVLNCMLK